jgi:phage-related protein (TIGR01555 family)
MPDNDVLIPSKEIELREVMNSMGDLVNNLTANGLFTGGAQLSQTDTMFYNNRWYLVSNNRNLLSQMYVEHGIVETLVDQPVDDAFRAGYKIATGQLDSQEMEDLEVFVEESRAIFELMDGVKWGRLYGGGGVLILTDQDPETPLDVEAIGPDSPLAFKAFDMWEVFQDKLPPQGDMSPVSETTEFYYYYGFKIHKTRILKVVGKKAPSFIRPRLRGWGVSVVEKLVRSINQYLKNQDVVFALLDEAKVDVYRIKGFNSALLEKGGTNAMTRRLQTANSLKNFSNALIMDAADEYNQKQMTFAGLSDMLLQIRQGIAADLRMPMTKIFGISAAGFNSGEDDIENYNAMVEGEIRSKNKQNVLELVKLCCQKKFQMIPDDMRLTWNPLRVLSAEQEENVKEKKFNRIQAAADSGYMEPKEYKMALNKDSLLPIELKENDDVFTAPTAGEDELTPAKGVKE